MYLKVHAEAKATFQKFLCNGSEYINRHLLAIMSLLGPLRRCCSGGALRDSVCLSADTYTQVNLVGGLVVHWVLRK